MVDVSEIALSNNEKIICLKDIRKRIVKSLYVYDQNQIPNSNYNYKIYIHGLLLYVASSNSLFNGELVSLIVNLNSILSNDFEKKQFKKIILECKNFIDYQITELEKQNPTE